MLGPQDRRLLLDALRPPDGYALDFVIGTTYSVDLLALLTAPLAFTLFDWQDAEGRPNADPLALLEALRRYADRVDIFCQAGQVLVPKQHRILFGYLEGSLHEVVPQGPLTSFHPKVWALRFTAPDEPVRYRLLCLSRNLTFDRSWDTALVLEGSVAERQNAIRDNHPLGEFFEALPALSKHEVSKETRGRIEQCAHDLRRVSFELPDGFDKAFFWPLGIPGRTAWPFGDDYARVLVVSPFLSAGLLGSLAQTANEAGLISRIESLDELPPGALEGFSSVHSLNPSADVEEAQTVPEGDGGVEEPTPAVEEFPLSGLHAKLYIAEHGWDASVFTGSANATSTAFGGNVEFLVQLVGKKSRVGIDAFLNSPAGAISFSDLLQPYTPSADAPLIDAAQRALEERVEHVRRLFAAAHMSAHVEEHAGEDLFEVAIRTTETGGVPVPAGVDVRCWPITLRDGDAVSVASGSVTVATFSRVSFTALTSFVAFEVVAAEGTRQACARFVLNLPLLGAPADRRERILRSLLNNREQVLRFLMFLLSEFGADGVAPDAAGDLLGGGQFRAGWGGLPLFESLLRALDQSPGKLDQVARLVDDLRGAGDGLLPDGFDVVWLPIWEARQKVNP